MSGQKQTYLDLGMQALAPYYFEVEGNIFLSNKDNPKACGEVKLDQRVTTPLIIQPRGEMRLAAQHMPKLGIGPGFNTVEADVRLRYEIRREFTPYFGIAQERKMNKSADYARIAGKRSKVTSHVAGVRIWL